VSVRPTEAYSSKAATQAGRLGAGQDATQRVGEQSGWIQTIPSGGDQQAGDHRAAPAGVRVADEQLFLLTQAVGRDCPAAAGSTRFVPMSYRPSSRYRTNTAH